MTWPLKVPKPSALTGAAAAGALVAGVVAAEEAVDPGAEAAEVLAAGLELTVESGTTTASLSVPWPPQPKTEAIKVTPRLRPRVAGLRIQLVVIAILLVSSLKCLLSGKYEGRKRSRPSPALVDPARASFVERNSFRFFRPLGSFEQIDQIKSIGGQETE